MALPSVTVFTTFFRPNRHYLDETVSSVLAQSFGDFEYLIVNDGPPEEGRRIEEKFRDPRLRVITNGTRAGLVASRNAGLREGRGEFLAVVDADDFCEPDRLRAEVGFLRTHPEHVLVGSAVRFVDENTRTIGYRRYPESDAEIRSRLLAFNCIAQTSVMLRRRACIEAGGYADEFRDVEDYDLWLRLARLGKLHNLPDALAGYRLHGDASKARMVRPVVRASIRVKLRAIRSYGYRASPRAFGSIAAHLLLLILPQRLVYSLFRLMIVR
jgi:glycosyltransferase involved in cell wall biosynthesis